MYEMTNVGQNSSREERVSMLMFLLGCMTGGTVGVVTMCLCAAAGDADRALEHDEKRR